ncbi:WD40/YVTN/BNR-like repeat-containing protein [Lentibacillus salicampi]|uniref:Oxidoreductase n=1 Tax=Lentibacillus salicampi TaxID=175306 RepID=A0A4Y9AAV9_9BACI|nr:oxidoreductase [Lentibacillus salicampi]TFJ92337.1 oxidoreductase [Lentibacillus salicampi]
MKHLILGLSIVMVICLSIGMYVNQGLDQPTAPQLNQPNDVQENATGPNQTAQPEQEPLRPVNRDTISYTLQNDELNITYNGGDDWIKVPIEKELLFNGEYRGDEQELIDGSYILTENRAAFLYQQSSVALTYFTDKGKTWQDSVVSESFPEMRFRKTDFLTDQFGYVIASGGRTMSQEYSTAFLTQDGGDTWGATADPPTTRLIADGGFLDATTGFLSYGTINPMEPDVYVTQDGGESWEKAVFHIPEKYHQVFVQADVPKKVDNHLSVLVNQGPNGDYKGGKVKGKFVSEDNGLTWNFSTEVQPDETKQQ